jgi:hypothetical protein
LSSRSPGAAQQSSGDWVVWNGSREVARSTRTLQPVGVYGNELFDLAGDSGAPPEALYGLRMNAALFPTLGVAPMLGRNVRPEEDRPNQPCVMILSQGLWTRRFHADPSVVGRTLRGSGRECLVIGVMGPGFNFPMRRQAAHTPPPYVEFWLAPLRMPVNPAAGFGAVARLRPGVSVEEARQDLASISRDLVREFPALNRDRELVLYKLRDRILRGADRSLWLLMAGALFFMLIGCANVANLLLARGAVRQREVAVRRALGAGPSRLVRQFLTESCVLAVLGGVGGYLLTAAGWKLLPAVAPVTIPRPAAARAGMSTFGCALAVAAINGILFGTVPALRMAVRSGAAVWGGFGSRSCRIPRRGGPRKSESGWRSGQRRGASFRLFSGRNLFWWRLGSRPVWRRHSFQRACSGA